MPRKAPQIRLHRPSGRAVVTLSDRRSHDRRDFYLGRFGEPAVAERYHLLLARWERDGRQLPGVIELGQAFGLVERTISAGTASVNAGVTIRVLIARYLRYADSCAPACGGSGSRHSSWLRQSPRGTRR